MLTCPSRGGGFGDCSETVLTSFSCPLISRGCRSDSIPCTSHPASAAFLLAIQKARCLLEYHDRHEIVESEKVQCPTDWVRQLSYIILRQCNKHAGVSSSTKEKSFWCRSCRPALLTAPASLFNQAFAAWLHSRAFPAEAQTVTENPLTDRLRLHP